MRNARNIELTNGRQSVRMVRETTVRGRRNEEAARNSLQFLVAVEGVEEYAGHVRGANGIRWRLA